MSDSGSESDSESSERGHNEYHSDSGESVDPSDVDQDDFFPAHDPDIEPEATEQGFAQYEEERAREEEMLTLRFSRQA